MAAPPSTGTNAGSVGPENPPGRAGIPSPMDVTRLHGHVPADTWEENWLPLAPQAPASPEAQPREGRGGMGQTMSCKAPCPSHQSLSGPPCTPGFGAPTPPLQTGRALGLSENQSAVWTRLCPRALERAGRGRASQGCAHCPQQLFARALRDAQPARLRRGTGGRPAPLPPGPRSRTAIT